MEEMIADSFRDGKGCGSRFARAASPGGLFPSEAGNGRVFF